MKKFIQSSYQNAIAWVFTGLLGFFALILSTSLIAQEVEFNEFESNLYVNAENNFQVNGKFTQASVNEVLESPDSIKKRKDNSEDHQLQLHRLGTGWGSVSRVLP